jgi:hypothetical protein
MDVMRDYERRRRKPTAPKPASRVKATVAGSGTTIDAFVECGCDLEIVNSLGRRAGSRGAELTECVTQKLVTGKAFIGRN